MNTLEFANSDRMPALGLGTWKSKPGEVFDAVVSAIHIGYRHIDCAPIYGNEKEIGEALKKCFDDKVVKREEMWITSKLWNDQHPKNDVVPALNNSLNDLQLSYLDLFLIHWPVAVKKGLYRPGSADGFISLKELPIADTWMGMESTLEKGLARHIGVSNFSVKKLEALVQGAKIKPEMNQIEMHPYLSQPDMVSYCEKNSIHLTAYSPLGSFDRSSKVKRIDEPVLMDDPALSSIAKEQGCTPAQVLIAWAMKRGTAVIPKSVSPERLKQNFEANHVSLTAASMEEINTLNKHYRYIDGSFWTPEGSPYTIANLWDE